MNHQKRLSNVSPLRSFLERSARARRIDSDWRLVAACRSTDPELFFPVSSIGKSADDVAAAKAVCGQCLVRRECLAFALRTRQVYGIWGGLSEEERERRSVVREDNRATLDPPAIA